MICRLKGTFEVKVNHDGARAKVVLFTEAGSTLELENMVGGDTIGDALQNAIMTLGVKQLAAPEPPRPPPVEFRTAEEE